MSARYFKYTCAVLATLFQTMGAPAHATHAISYRWQSPHVTMTYQDVVGTPVPPSYGFRANMQDLGHKKRLAESFLRTFDRGLIGDRLDIQVSIYGDGGIPASMVLTGRESKATVEPPFTDQRFAFALRGMAETSDLAVPQKLTSDQLAEARKLLGRFPDDALPVLSPDGKRIAFLSWRGEAVDAYVTDLDSMRTTRLGATRAVSSLPLLAYSHGILHLPMWSPDGSMIAYVADARAVVVDTSRNSGRLLNSPEVDDAIIEIAWSPDGQMLAGTVAAREASTVHAQDVVLLDPTGKRAPVSLKERLPIFRHGDFEARLFWSPDSETLGIVVNLNGSVRDSEGIDTRNTMLYLIDAASLDTRSVEVTGWAADAVWSVGSDTLALVVRPREGRARLVNIAASSLEVEDVYSTEGQMFIFGVAGRRIGFIEDDAPMVADADARKAERIPNVRVETVNFIPGFFGGYLGVESETITDNEPGRRIVLIEYSEGLRAKLPGLAERLPKDWGEIFITPPGTLKAEWVSQFVRTHEVVHLDWSPRSGVVASVSPGGGSSRILQARPAEKPRDLSAEIDRRKVEVIDRWLKFGEAGGGDYATNPTHTEKTGNPGLVESARPALILLAVLLAVGLGILIRRLRAA